jgi:hypothetical protein
MRFFLKKISNKTTAYYFILIWIIVAFLLESSDLWISINLYDPNATWAILLVVSACMPSMKPQAWNVDRWQPAGVHPSRFMAKVCPVAAGPDSFTMWHWTQPFVFKPWGEIIVMLVPLR